MYSKLQFEQMGKFATNGRNGGARCAPGRVRLGYAGGGIVQELP